MIRKKNISTLSLLVSILLIASCSPVNFTTRTKRVPRLYSVNYNYPNVKSECSEKNKLAWVVYSDRAENATQEQPGGMLKHSELDFMEPLLVIGQKGDYYKLLKYNPAILKGNRLANRREAEYCGWIHKDRLLLFDNSVSEVRNNLKLKSLTAIKSHHIIGESHLHIQKDSLILYAQPKLKEAIGASMGLNNVVYIFKLEDNDSKALIAYQPEITPETAQSALIGWVDAGLTVPMGQRLIMGRAPMIKNEAGFTDILTSDSVRPSTSPFKAFYPVLFADRDSNTLHFRSLDAGSIIDRSNNRIYNVNGEAISYAQSRTLAEELLNVNVIFAFDLSPNVLEQIPMLTNIIQNVKELFEESPSELNYHFAAVLGDELIPFESNYLTFSDQLIEKAQNVEVSQTQHSSVVLSKALDIAGQMPKATNLIVNIGEKSGNAEYSSHALIKRFIANNCRLLSYQVYAGNNNIYNNFVLQSASIIEAYADTTRVIKRGVIVNPDRLCKISRFKENLKNTYALDYPRYSMTQGMVVFPEKNQTPETGLLTNALDSMIRQIEHDNLLLIADMDKVFHQVGNHRNQYAPGFISRFGMTAETKVSPKLHESFEQVSPQWVAITERISIPLDSLLLNDLFLLLTEQETTELNEFIGLLSEKKPDMKGKESSQKRKVRKEKQLRKDLLHIPADSQLEVNYSSTLDTLQTNKEYANTRKIRQHLKKTYLDELKRYVKKSKTKHLSLAQAQEHITNLPTFNTTLAQIRIKDLRSRKKVSDKELEDLIHYFENYKKEIEKQKKAADELNKNGSINYFIVPALALP